MLPNSSKRRSQPTGGSKTRYDTSSIPSKESDSSRNSFYDGMGLLIVKLLKTGRLVIQKKVTITTDLGNVKENSYDSPSPETPWNNNPNALYGAAGRDATEPYVESEPHEPIELDAPIPESSQCVPNLPGGRIGAGGLPGSQRPHTNGFNGRVNGRSSNAPSQIAPSHRSNGLPAPGSQSAQGQHGVAHSSYHDPDFAPTGGLAVLQHNVNETHEDQIVGINVKPTYDGPDDLRQETANVDAQWNLHLGDGSQVVGQRVRRGAWPRQFAGKYVNNKNFNGGEQIIGVDLG